jgi:hypothetical protein
VREETIWTGPEIAAEARASVGKKITVQGRRGRVISAGELTITLEIETPAEAKRRDWRFRMTLRWISRVCYSVSMGWNIAIVAATDFHWSVIPMALLMLASWIWCELAYIKNDRNNADNR